MQTRQRARQESHETNGDSNGKQKNGAEHKNGVKNGSMASDSKTGEAGALALLVQQTLMPLFLMAFSPNLVILLWYTAAKCDGSFLKLFERLTENGFVNGIAKVWSDINIASPVAVYVILCYCLFALTLMIILPGPRAEGPVTPKGNTPVYKDNGFFCYIVTITTFWALAYYMRTKGLTPTIVYDQFDSFLGTLTVFSHVLCIFLVIKGLTFPSSADSGSSGNPIFDYYWGTELYPRVFGIDIKVFTNCRFGMTVWPLLCCIFALKSYELYGFVDSMWVSWYLQMLYFTKFFWWESGYMKTIDIMLDRAGFYICWGCLAYVPGLYASVSMYLVKHPVHLGPFWSSVIVVAGTASVAINYIADWEKQVVRRTNGKCKIWGKEPEIIRAKYQTEDGCVRESILLLSGFWGIARHFHYVPELLLAFFWTVPALMENVMAYSYVIWLFLLLTHRTFRDDTKCSKKYAKYWDEYSKRVPYKMIPGIF